MFESVRNQAKRHSENVEQVEKHLYEGGGNQALESTAQNATAIQIDSLKISENGHLRLKNNSFLEVLIDIHTESEFDEIRCLICGTPSLDENSEVIDCSHLVLTGMNVTDEVDEEDLIDRYHFKREYMKNKNEYNSFFDFLESYLDDSFVYIRLID